jgi:hypothetical protein
MSDDRLSVRSVFGQCAQTGVVYFVVLLSNDANASLHNRIGQVIVDWGGANQNVE